MVYLIHFSQPYKHARHYIGFTDSETAEQRLERHRSGRGARLLQVVNAAGISYDIVRTWPDGDRNFERHLKNGSHSKRHCPACKEMEHGVLRQDV